MNIKLVRHLWGVDLTHALAHYPASHLLAPTYPSLL
jgi:hypothetical protein